MKVYLSLLLISFIKAEPSKTVELLCDCHNQIGIMFIAKQCEWVWVDDEECPEVPYEDQVVKKYLNFILIYLLSVRLGMRPKMGRLSPIRC